MRSSWSIALLAAACCHASTARTVKRPVLLAGFGAAEYPWPWQDRHEQHDGLDVAAPRRDAHAIAISDGVVLSVGHPRHLRDDQQTVWMYHPKLRRRVLYVHIVEPVLVHAGDHVSRGQPLGSIWMPHDINWVMHVHVTVCVHDCRDAQFEDPLPYLRSCLSTAGPDDVVFPVEC